VTFKYETCEPTRFQVESGKALRELIRLERAARERVLRELVVGPAVPVAMVETDDGEPLSYPRPWGVALDDGSIAWFENYHFTGWNSHTPR
jgi:hypothetical protein